jgi:putative ABC transport system permease protein
MFQNYLAVALRSIVRHKLYSFINIAGLTVGLTCAIFIALFVRDQLSYDRWIPGTENLYRLEESFVLPGKAPKYSAMTPIPAVQVMLDQIPEVQARTRLMRKAMTVLIGSRQFPQRVYFADPNFLQVIRLPLRAGGPAAALSKPESVVLSETMAHKYFSGENPIGKTIVISGQRCNSTSHVCEPLQQPLVVTGVLKDLPHNTQFETDVLVPNTSAIAPITDAMRANWFAVWCWSYVRLSPGADPNAVLAKFNLIIDRSVDTMKQMNIKARGSDVLRPQLTPFVDAHLSTDQYRGMTPPGSWAIVYGFGAIGGLILLIACFNFTNLATARAMMRAREISLRKVVGAERGQLIVQFLGEALMTAMIALFFASALTEILMPSFDRLLGLPITLNYGSDWQLVLLAIGVGAAAGLLSGAYPALVLSSLRPVMALRANQGGVAGSGRLRTLLVVLQFSVSIGLGIAAAVIFAQISFARNLDLGFRKDAIVVVNTQNIPGNTIDSLADALRKGGDITDVATTDTVPFDNDHWNIIARSPGSKTDEELALVYASPDYMKLYGIRLIAGRFLSDQRGVDAFSPDPHGNSQPVNVLVNAAAARRLGYAPQAAIGKIITLTPHITGSTGITIAGVVADTMQDGSKNPVQGTIYLYQRAFSPLLLVRIRAEHIQDGLSFIDTAWHAFAPVTAMQRHFVDDDYNRQFQTDERQGMLFNLFVGIAIFVACLGLFGLAAFSTERRTREIGLRKTFGARTGDIIWMLLRQFSVPVLIANLIAWPVAWYYLQSWLQGFAYRIPLSPLYFVGAGAVALCIAWVTVLIHAVRVARANPIHALRYE